MSIWRTGVTHAALASIGLMLGLILGGLGPRTELRAMQAAKPAPQSSVPSNAGAQVARLFQGRPVAASTGRDAPIAAPRDTDTLDTDVHTSPMSEANLATMRQAMAVRLAGARAALAEDAAPTTDQQQELDVLFGAMNEDLKTIAHDFVALATEREPTRRDMERFAADTLDILISTEDRFDEILSAEQRDALADESRDPLSYVDPSLVDILEGIDL